MSKRNKHTATSPRDDFMEELRLFADPNLDLEKLLGVALDPKWKRAMTMIMQTLATAVTATPEQIADFLAEHQQWRGPLPAETLAEIRHTTEDLARNPVRGRVAN
jgi:hypothetical protein